MKRKIKILKEFGEGHSDDGEGRGVEGGGCGCKDGSRL